MSKKGSVAILTPAYNGHIHIQNAHSTAQALFYLKEAGWDVGWIHYGNVASVTKARNALVSEAVTNGFTDMVFIDSDIAYAPESLEKLLEHDLDLVAGVQRNNMATELAGVVNPFPYAVEPLKRSDGTPYFEVNEGLAEVISVPTAFMRIRTKPIKELMTKVPELQYHDDNIVGADEHLYALFDHRLHPHPRYEGKQKYHGEDYAFCRLWREHGYKVHADLSIPLRHIKTVNLDGAPIVALKNMQKMQRETEEQ